MNLCTCLSIVLFYINSYTCTQQSVPLWKRKNLRAVTRFEGIDEYYQTLLIQKSKVKTIPVESTGFVQKKICKKVFNSPYFEMQQEEWVDPDLKEIRAELKNDYYKNIFDSVYRKSKLQFLPFMADHYKYKNSYKTYTISINETKVIEKGFMCLVRDPRSKRINTYFVSSEYNVNSLSQPEIAGRFIFFCDHKNNLTLYAMAEEYAKPFDPGLAGPNRPEWYFYLKLRIQTRISTPIEEKLKLICKMTEGEKLRLCASVFSSPIFKNIVKFFPTLKNIQRDCEQKTVSIMNKNFRKEIRSTYYRIPRVPMFACTTFQIGGREKIIYYVSRADRNEVFVYKYSDENLFVHAYLVGVGALR